MKKMLFAGAIQLALFLNAQNTSNSQNGSISYGLKGGLNISNATDKSFGYLNQKSRIGFNAGTFVNIPISKSFSIQPELLFSQYGYKTEYDFSLINTEDGYDPLLIGKKATYTTNLGYIVIPIMVQYSIIPNLYVEVGPEFGINIIAQEKRTIDIDKEFFKTFNFGISFGAGYYVTDNIGITARYVAGLTDIYNRPSGSDAIKNNVFQFGIVYRFKKQ
ncbi:PorT family protein [Chryseobacterium sp. L7]|uniref:PorT family protein n=1 Tax=Chryseobacterium endalhagicum TaxID=2797638 RepID=A0ABS1QD30_9FLAO|nr:porin family protein [Chryseobacterium endalhagicum]MBL1220211.1 PorT family protein [Chryseobacterium endalhagicum]